MNSKTITISGKEVTFTASAATPRLYRACFKREIFKDLQKIEREYKDTDGEIPSMEVFEDIAYVMAGVPFKTPGKTVEEWLNEFDAITSINEMLPVIFELWGVNVHTNSEQRKNEGPLTEI